MQASYNRWWEGRTQWDHLSAVSRNLARTVWLHVPPPRDKLLAVAEGGNEKDKRSLLRVIHALAVSLKHHLRGERDWDDPEMAAFRELVEGIGGVCTIPSHPSTESGRLMMGI
jgi:putative membrane protein